MAKDDRVKVKALDNVAGGKGRVLEVSRDRAERWYRDRHAIPVQKADKAEMDAKAEAAKQEAEEAAAAAEEGSRRGR